MSEALSLERLLRRDRAITLAGLVALCVLAWFYLLAGAGLDMSAWDMTTLSLFPHLQAGGATASMPGMDMSGTQRPASGWGLMLAMWWIMMIAMMLPAAAPTILLYARVYRHAGTQAAAEHQVAPTGAFAAGYLLVWLFFAALATALHWALERSGLISDMMMGSQSRLLSAAVLLAAGAYQLSPLKNACLAHCRAPASFLALHWRPHASGALRLGMLHGAYCVGCCWVLMLLLLVGGVMNLVWIIALAVLVLTEKVAPAGGWAARGAGLVLIAWGVATLAVGNAG